MKITFHHVVEIKLDVCAQHRLDRLLDLLEFALSRDALTPEEKASLAQQLRDQTDKLRGTRDAAPPIHPTSPTT